jgi:hypothetical protein
MTEAQMAEKPITVAIDEAISSLTGNRQRRLAVCVRRCNGILAPENWNAPAIVAATLSQDKRFLMG